MKLMIPRIIASLFVVLVMNSVALDPCILASESGQTAPTDAELPEAPAGTADVPDSLASPQGAGGEAFTAPSRPFDQLILTGQGAAKSSDTPARKGAPIYKRWWFWTVAGSAVATAVILSVAGAEESRKDLPDFPNPPDR